MNIKDAYIHNGDAILKDIQLNGSKLQKLKAGKKEDDTYLTWVDVLDLSPFGASGHNHDDRYLKLTGGTLALGEGLKFHADENYFGINLDARIISLLDGNGTTCDGGLIIDERATSNGVEHVTELLRIRDSEFKWKGNDIYHTNNLSIKTLMGSTAIGDSDEPVYWNGSSFVKAGAYPTKASWNYDDRYLKLSGGTLTGSLSIQTQDYEKDYATSQQLVINGPNYDANATLTPQAYPGIGFHMPNRTWANLIWDGHFTGMTGSFNNYVSFYGSGFIKDGSSDNYVLLGGGGHKLLSDFSMAHEHPYLPLAGGTMTGSLTVKQYIFGYNYNHAGANAPAFVFDKPGSNYTGIGANGEADTIYFSAATFSNGEASWVTSYKQKWKFNGTIYQENNAVIHSGNIGSQSVNYATNADKLDGYHENDFFRNRGPLYQNHDYDANTLGIGEYVFRSSAYSGVGTGAEHVNALNENSTIQVFKWLQMSAVAWSDSMSYRLSWSGETNAQRPNGWSPWITFVSSSNYTEYTVKKDGTGASGTWNIHITGGLTIQSIYSETDINSNYLKVYAGVGDAWTGEISSMAYSAILGIGDPSRGFQLWAQRGDGTMGCLHYRVGTFDAHSWNTERILIDNETYNLYSPKLDGTGASGTWGISITGNAKTATTSTYASNVGSSGTAGTNYVTAANVISMYNWYNSITATDEASNTAIDKWNEIVSFLTGITDTSTLSGILAGYAAAGHNHDKTYLKLSGGTLTGSKNVLTLSNNSGGDIGLKFSRNTNTSWEIIDTGGNLKFNELFSNTTRLVLYENSQGGSAVFKGLVSATGFSKLNSSDSYLLLGGGGHKAVSDFAAVSSLNNYVLKKPDTRFYNYIGCSTRSNWYKITLPFHNTTSTNNRWMMVSMELILKGNYSSGADGTIYLSYYIYYPANNNIGIADKVYAVAIGSNMNNVRIAYNKTDLGIFYVYVPNDYNSFAIQNLSANDNAPNYDFTTTTIDALSSSAYPVDSEIQDINIRKLYTIDGTSLMLNGNVLIDAGNIGSQSVSYANSADNARNLLGRTTTGSDYGAVDGNLVFAEWDTYNDTRWYLKAKGYETRVGYANNSDKLDGQDLITQVSDWDTDSLSIFKSSEDLSSNAPTTDFLYGLTLRFHRNNSTYHTDLVSKLYSDALFFRRKTESGYGSWRELIHSGNISSQSVNYATNAGYATSAGNADTVDNYHLASWIYPTSPRDFTYGTRIDTDIVYNINNGDAFYMEIIGDTYFSLGSIYTIVQGYIYNGTIISYSVNNLGRVRLEHLYAMLIGDNLVFWFERLGYWQSYRIGVYKSSSGNYWENHCTSITNSAKPTGTKEIDLCVTASGTVHTFNNAFLDSKVSGAESADSVPWSGITDKPTFTTWSETLSTASYSLSNASWTNTITLPTTAGSYILNIVSGNSTLTGVFSIGASDNAKDEISLHLHGNGPRLYARTNGTTLQLSSNDASATSRSVTIKYRRMI